MKAILSSTIILALLFASCAAKPVAATTTGEVVIEKPVDLTADLMEGKY